MIRKSCIFLRLEEECSQQTEKSKELKKTVTDAQTRYAQDTEKLKKRVNDIQTELLTKTDEVGLMPI